MTDEDFFEAFVDYMDYNGLIGVRYQNSADKYKCPSCDASLEIKGYASFTESLMFYGFEHSPDCKLMDMYRHAFSRVVHG